MCIRDRRWIVYVLLPDRTIVEQSSTDGVTWSSAVPVYGGGDAHGDLLSLIHISEPTRPYSISYAVFCL